MKLATSITQAMSIPDPISFVSCSALNELSFQFAQDIATEKALKRFNAKGRPLTFEDDIVQEWNSGWEDKKGISYTFYDDNSVGVASLSVITDNDFVPVEDSGMHYCDLLSPFKALEWIYVTGIRHAPHT